MPFERSTERLERIRKDFPQKRSVFALIAQGPNRLFVPCMFFKTLEEGLEFCRKVFPEEERVPRMTPEYLASRWGVREAYEDGEDYLFSVTRDWLEENWESLFFGYYGGCGWPGGFLLREVPFGERLFHWDLD